MKKVLNILKQKWYLVLIAAICIIIQVNLQLYLPELMGNIQNLMPDASFDIAAKEEAINNILIQGGYMLLTALGVAIMALTQNYCGSTLGAYVGKELRKEMFMKVNSLSLTNYNKFGTATLITRTTNDIEQVKNLVAMSIRTMIMSPTFMIVALVKIMGVKGKLAIVLGIAVPIITVSLIIIATKAMPLFRQIQEKIDHITIVLRESLTGIRVVRAYNQQQEEYKKFDKANINMKNTIVKVESIMAFLDPIINITFDLCFIGIYAFGFSLLANQPVGTDESIKLFNNSITEIAVTAQYSMQIMMSFLMLAGIFIMIPSSSASIKRINEVLNTFSEIKEREFSKEELDAINNNSTKGIIEFKNVYFTYPDAKYHQLEDISFKTKPGTTTAIIGSTGSGKSTLINLIPRFYDCTNGEILIDGINIKNMPQKLLRDKLGFVPQTALLFKGTIKDNIKFGKPDATDEEINEALSVAQTFHFIDKLPDKINSYVAQGGKNFSGGQKQRLAIARALVRKPEIYVFDDSFSALDFKTDSKLRAALKEYAKESSVIVVAQRVSSIIDADNIIVLNEGKCVGQGTHNELLQNCEVYRDIVKSQLDLEEIELTLKMNQAALKEGGK